MSNWKWEDFLLWNTLEPVLSAVQQNCGGPQDDVRTLHEYLQVAEQQQAVYQVAYAQSRVRKGGKHHESFNVRDKNRVYYFHTQAATDYNYPIELYQVLYQKPQYYVDFKGRNQEFEHHILQHLNWLNGKLYPGAFRALEQGGSFDATVDAMVSQRFMWLDEEMRGILRGYLKQKPVRTIFLMDIEPVNNHNPQEILADPQYYFTWLEPVYEILRDTLNALGIAHVTNVSGKGYHIVSAIPLYEDGRENPALLNLMEIGGMIQEETAARLVYTYYGSRKFFPVPLLTERAHHGCYKLMQYLLVNLADRMKARMQQWGFPPHLSFCDDGDFLVSLDMTAMLNPVDRRDFGMPGQIYGKTHDHMLVRVVREINGYDFFGKGFASNEESLARMFAVRSDLDLAKAHMIRTGARIPEASASGFNKLIAGYRKSRIKSFHDQLEYPIDNQEIAYLINSDYAIVRRLCPQLGDLLDCPDSDVFLNPQSLTYFYSELEAAGFGIGEQLHITYAIYHDPRKAVDIPEKYSRAVWAKWPVLLKGYHYRD
jgi:hypothetical protein